MISELITIRDYIRWAVSRFNAHDLHFGHGTDNAWDEAVALILHTLHLPLDVNPQVLDARLTQTEREEVMEMIIQRFQKRVPTPYLTHRAWFAGMEFYVDDRVIIPRSPIGELIEDCFEPWIAYESVNRILDMCTGSGCIAIASAVMFPDCLVDAVDISAEVLEVAKINVEKHQVEESVQLIQSDLFQNVPAQTYDIIVSNPPYVSADDMQALPDEFRHEPTLALAGGHSGLYFAVTIIKGAIDRLTPHGILVLEVGNSQEQLLERYPTIPFTWIRFERGGDGVLVMTAQELKQYRDLF